MKATKEQMQEWLDNESLNFTTSQKGYGRQALYVQDYYLMDVYPNIEEYFGLTHENDSFYNEEEEIYTDCNGNEIDEECIYSNLDQFLCKYLKSEIQDLIEDDNEDE